ncbi:MAG: permease-like cell division protein FtsX [Oscillospiraceae bacterium]|nr:permease-like cell division protein FtsX [Oscillospiraceae bacterium]MDD7293684.1 permease-like cell division protein FtsX [Clostridiaceae bacterium]MDY5991279.1 permease-like cell division protein FtsX [Oscillospiraceae bacterium]
MANNTAKSKAKKKKGRSGSSGGLNTSYLTKMGFRNLVTNRSMSLSSISVLTACLLLIGVSFLLLFNMKTLVSDVEKQNVVVAFVKDGIDETAKKQVQADLKAIPNVTEVQYVSKEEGFNEQLEDFGVERNMIDGVIENPLPDSYRITVSNIEEFSTTLAAIKAVANVESVRESQEIIKQISTLQKSVTFICLIIVAILIVVSLFIIANTIKITMVSRKVDIQVMKSVGATNVFICWPFMIEGIAIGLISGLIAMGLTYVVEITEGDALNSLFSLFGSSVVNISDFWYVLVIGYFVSGMLLGSFGSVVSIRKYLKKEGSEANDI